MTDRERPMDDRDLDLLLGAWLSEGPTMAAERIAERAMLEVATTPQEGTRLAAIWGTAGNAPLAWAAGLLALAIGLGIVLGPSLIGVEPSPSPIQTSPSPSISPSPSADPTAIVSETFTFEEAGFTVELPSSWQTQETENATHIIITGPDGGISARYSDANGEIPACMGEPGCQLVPAASIADLIGIVRGEYVLEWGLTASPQVTQEPVTLDGVAATRVAVRPPTGMTGPGTSRVVLIGLEDRVLILEWIPRYSGAELWDEIVASVRLIDQSAPQNGPGPAVEVHGLSVRLPAGWAQCDESGQTTFRMASDCRHGTQHTDSTGGLTAYIAVRVGVPGATPSYCTGLQAACRYSTGNGCLSESVCTDRPIRGFADLWGAVSETDAWHLADTNQREVELDGEAALLLAASRDFLEGQIVVDKTWILAIRDRPYVVILSAPEGSMPDGWEDAVIGSMNFAN